MTSATERLGLDDDDAALVRRASEGDMKAFEELVMRHADGVYVVLRRFGLDDDEARDVAQETFLRAWRGLPRFEGRARFFTWLYRIAYNEAQRRLSKRPPAGAVVSTEELLDRVWDDAVDPFTNVVRMTVSRLRAKLGDPPVVETVTPIGYRIGGAT